MYASADYAWLIQMNVIIFIKSESKFYKLAELECVSSIFSKPLQYDIEMEINNIFQHDVAKLIVSYRPLNIDNHMYVTRPPVYPEDYERNVDVLIKTFIYFSCYNLKSGPLTIFLCCVCNCCL